MFSLNVVESMYPNAACFEYNQLWHNNNFLSSIFTNIILSYVHTYIHSYRHVYIHMYLQISFSFSPPYLSMILFFDLTYRKR